MLHHDAVVQKSCLAVDWNYRPVPGITIRRLGEAIGDLFQDAAV
jgi:hypothetical protein